MNKKYSVDDLVNDGLFSVDLIDWIQASCVEAIYRKDKSKSTTILMSSGVELTYLVDIRVHNFILERWQRALENIKTAKKKV